LRPGHAELGRPVVGIGSEQSSYIIEHKAKFSILGMSEHGALIGVSMAA
jgi:hypothetical protein